MMQAYSGQPSTWNELIASLPYQHLLQTWQWAEVKAKYGWKSMPFTWNSHLAAPTSQSVAAAMILKRSIPVSGFARKMCVLYVPKGPLLDWTDVALRACVLEDLQAFARRQGAIFIKIDPDVIMGVGIPGNQEAVEDKNGQNTLSDLTRRGWMISSNQIQFRNTVMLDLSFSEVELLAQMKQKTRYNVRLAEKKGVTVRPGTLADLPMLYRMYAETSVRDGFVIRDEGYYRMVWETFMVPSTLTPHSSNPYAEPLIAEFESQAIAAIFVYYFAGRAYYLHGMSLEMHREKMPNHLLQWESLRRAKAAGCKSYDLWGAPEIFDESDPLWGVFRFKEGLGGQVVRTLGAWDFTPSPMLYKMYTRVILKVLDVMRLRGKARTRQDLNQP